MLATRTKSIFLCYMLCYALHAIEKSTQHRQDGAAAVVCWLVGDLCVVANAGDAKAVLARQPDKARNTAASTAKRTPLSEFVLVCGAISYCTRSHLQGPSMMFAAVTTTIAPLIGLGPLQLERRPRSPN
jgi:hypothetical protein